jgi:hypothetical protein
MKHRLVCTLVLTLGLFLVPLVSAQDQTRVPYPSSETAGDQAVPPELVLPAGTLVLVRLSDPLSSDRNNPGDSFTAVLDQPLVAQGWVVARRGQAVVGQVTAAQKAGRVQGVSQLALELTGVVTVDGSQLSVHTELVQASAGTSQGRDAAAIGTTTGIGAIIGAAAGGGEGAAIGAAAGAAAGIAGVLSTRGQPTVLYPETLLTFRLLDPATITTQQAQQAFRPVNQADYGSTSAVESSPRPLGPTESYPPPYYYPPYYPPYYYSPYYYYPYYYYPGYGFYGFYGYGPRIFVNPRGYIPGRGFGRHRR